MAHALETVEQARILIDHPLLTATYGKYSYRIERKGDQSLYSVTDGTATITMPIRWALGASSALGQTYILEKDGKFYESRMSWFRELNRSRRPIVGPGRDAALFRMSRNRCGLGETAYVGQDDPGSPVQSLSRSH
jgi:hypothetical protein